MKRLTRFITNLKYEIIVLILFVLSRVPQLGYDIFNTDTWKWKARIYDFGSGIFGLDFALTIQKYHPGVTLMWLGTIGVKVYNAYNDVFLGHPPINDNINTVFELHFVQKLILVTAIGLTISSVFYVLRKLFGLQYSILTVMLISLEPFYLALTRVLHLEGLMSTFMIASFLWLYYYLFDTHHKSRLYVSAFFSSLAILTKSSALFMLPFTGLMMFVWFLYSRHSLKKSLTLTALDYSKWLFSFLIIFILLWPAMWVVPLEALKVVYRGISDIGIERGHEQFYFGRLVNDPGVVYYLIVIALRSSAYLLPGLIGSLLVIKRIEKGRQNFIFYVLLFSLLYLVEITIPSKKLDRYVLPTIMGFTLVSSFFYSWLCSRFGAVLKNNRAKVITCLLFMLPAIFTIVFVHPDYFSFYSPYTGGLKKGIFILEPKWIIGQKEIKQYFVKLKNDKGYEDFGEGESLEELVVRRGDDKNLVVAFPEKYYTQVWPFMRQIGAWAVILELGPHANVSDYVVFPVWDDQSEMENRFILERTGTIKLRGVDLYNVYERIPLPLYPGI